MRSRVSWPFVAICTGLILVCSLIFLLAPRDDAQVPFTPTNAGPSGSRALAQVLQRHGVQVHEAHGLAQMKTAISAHPRNTTVLITAPGNLTEDSLDDVLLAAHGSRIVALDPSDAVRKRLFARPSDSEQGSIYPPTGQARRVVINDAGIMANAGVARGDNAQLALRTLGQDPHLVWISDWQGHSSAPSTGLAWPVWKTPLIWSLAIAALFLIATRGRRFGRLATEPLPVLVKSIESTRSLAILYRKSRARETAASALQAGTSARLAKHLGLPRGSRSPADVIEALGDHHRDQAECLLAPPPASDQALIELANRLTTLEKESTRD